MPDEFSYARGLLQDAVRDLESSDSPLEVVLVGVLRYRVGPLQPSHFPDHLKPRFAGLMENVTAVKGSPPDNWLELRVQDMTPDRRESVVEEIRSLLLELETLN